MNSSADNDGDGTTYESAHEETENILEQFKVRIRIRKPKVQWKRTPRSIVNPKQKLIIVQMRKRIRDHSARFEVIIIREIGAMVTIKVGRIRIQFV